VFIMTASEWPSYASVDRRACHLLHQKTTDRRQAQRSPQQAGAVRDLDRLIATQSWQCEKHFR
jgi:hypothetical protein